MAERRFSKEGPSPLVVAHRGASLEEPENTLPAFEAAVEAGADAVEFDVRLSADGHAVVIHDAAVDRTTDGVGLVRDLTLRELKRLTARSSAGEPAEIPTLAEVLALLSGRAAVDVEIKTLPGDPDAGPVAAAVVRALDASGFSGGVLLSSFDLGSIGRARALDPTVTTGLLSVAAMPPDDAIAVALGAGHGWVLPEVSAVRAAGAELVTRAHDAGLRIGTWIVDDPSSATLLGSWEVDAIATNDPAGIVAALGGGRR